ncbi:hypothetical protein BDZ89DRAFT_1080879 [Hymenopellis radicata]|nr:hypothetical protein BDZ89DRAFT_1080879 [Hymenopellis radicata]
MQSILDPAYYSKHTSAQPRVFVDRQGNMHDPDYRHFPSVSSYSSGSYGSSSSATAPVEEEEEIYVDPFSPQARRSSSLPLTRYSSPSPNPPSDPKPRKGSFKKCRSRGIRWIPTEEEYYLSTEEEDEEQPKSHDESCSAHSVKRQLQSVSLSLSVSAFRARRKVKEALHHHHHQRS